MSPSYYLSKISIYQSLAGSNYFITTYLKFSQISLSIQKKTFAVCIWKQHSSILLRHFRDIESICGENNMNVRIQRRPIKALKKA